jgi:16S rRNA (guanine527-N7)-methyltransferase
MPARTAAHLATARRHDLDRFLDEIAVWNRRVNLTTVPREAAWERHIAESCRLLDAMRLDGARSLIDVGSGAGIPGVVLALLLPELEVTLLESDRRKAAFLIHVAGMLRLGNVTVLARRAEEAGHDPALRERFDLAVSRAAAPPALLCELALPLLTIGGGLWALVADPAAAAGECAAIPADLGGGPPVAMEEDGVLHVMKRSHTAAGFPRRSALSRRS